MTNGTHFTVDTSIATRLVRVLLQEDIHSRQALVGPFPVVTILCAPGVELPVVFHGDDLPGLLFVSYRGDTIVDRITEVLDAASIDVRRIPIREDEYRQLMDGIAVDHFDLVALVVSHCCRDEDCDMDNIAD